MTSQPVDLIIRNARIHCVDGSFSLAQAMAVHQGRVTGIGSAPEIDRHFHSAETVDAEGRCVYPGFFDPHSHLLNYGFTLDMVDLGGSRSWGEVVERCRRHAGAHGGPWLLGRGWDQNLWEQATFPSSELLDQAFPNRPVLLVRIDGHAAVASRKALELAGVDAGTRIDGGEFLAENGRLTGMLIDLAVDRVREAVPKPGPEDRIHALLQAQERCLAVGLTSVCDAGVSWEEALLMEALHAAGSLKLRIYAMLNPDAGTLARVAAEGPRCTERLSMRSIKMYADGALGSMGALLLEPYEGSASRGLQLVSRDHLDEICRLAARSGFQVNTHCIGDAAVRLVLDVYGRHLEPGNDRRWRIEHAQVVHPEDLPRFGQLGVVPSIQTTHATSDMAWAARVLGSRIRRSYCYQDLLGQNGWLPNGSDFPIEHVNPVYGFYAAVARRSLSGQPQKGFQTENALTREQALRAMTIWAARANFEDQDRGSLEVGKWADFVILDRDLMHAPEPDLPGTQVLATYIAGEQVYRQ